MRAEWLSSPVVEPKAVNEIEDRLTGYDTGSRLDHLPVDQPPALAIDHLEAVLERERNAKFLTAFLALPQLRKSSRIAMPERRACNCP